MSDTVGTICAAVIASALTLFGALYLQKQQNDVAQQAKFMDGAQATAQETSKLLAEGYRELERLKEEALGKTAAEYMRGPEEKYQEFYQGWRQRLIENQFKVIRYFGKDAADMLMHLDEIDISPVNNLGSPNPCSAPGDKDSGDMHKIAEQLSCYIRFSTLKFDKMEIESEADHLINTIQRQSEIKDNVRALMENYEVNYVIILRKLDARLTELGMSKVTVVQHKS